MNVSVLYELYDHGRASEHLSPFWTFTILGVYLGTHECRTAGPCVVLVIVAFYAIRNANHAHRSPSLTTIPMLRT